VTPLRVGLVGAGPWAGLLHAPMFAAGPNTTLAGVWARRPAAAAELAGAHGSVAFERYEDLLDACEAVVFAVPPDVQASMATTAASRGKAVLLEKPLALSLDAAERLADAVGAAGVASMVVLTWRYSPRVRAFLAAAESLQPVGGRGWFLSGALLGGWFSTPWRLEHGGLPDLGPHVVDLLDAALGPVVSVRAHGESLKWVGLLLEHASGAVSEASLSGTIDPQARRSGCDVFNAAGSASVDTGGVSGEVIDVIRDEFVQAVAERGGHPLDVQRGLHLQRIITDAQAQLAAAR
jgi:predicted dehydrogenase